MADWKEEIRQRLANLKLESTREAEIVEELAQHLEQRYIELLTSGVTTEEASRAVLAELSDSEVLQRELRRVERAVPQQAVVPGYNSGSNLPQKLNLPPVMLPRLLPQLRNLQPKTKRA